MIVPRSAPTVNAAAPGFGATLRLLRERRGLSQLSLARQNACDSSLISRLESGERGPTRETAKRLADLLARTFAERESLLAAGGFVTEAQQLLADPEAIALAQLLVNPALPDWRRAQLRETIRLLLTSWGGSIAPDAISSPVRDAERLNDVHLSASPTDALAAQDRAVEITKR